MDTHVELSKKTTILFSSQFHAHLTRVAEQRGVSLGRLIRDACEAHYGSVSAEDRLQAVRDLAGLNLPVSDPQTMKRESVPNVEDLDLGAH